MRRDWISLLLLLVYMVAAFLAMHRGTQLATELKECRESHLDYTKYVNKRLCDLGRKVGTVLDGCQEG